MPLTETPQDLKRMGSGLASTRKIVFCLLHRGVKKQASTSNKHEFCVFRFAQDKGLVKAGRFHVKIPLCRMSISLSPCTIDKMNGSEFFPPNKDNNMLHTSEFMICSMNNSKYTQPSIPKGCAVTNSTNCGSKIFGRKIGSVLHIYKIFFSCHYPLNNTA